MRLALTHDQLNQVRIDTQQADALLACDMVVGASPEALATIKHGRSAILVNTHELATAAFVRDPDADLHSAFLIDKMRHAAGARRCMPPMRRPSRRPCSATPCRPTS